MLGRRRWTTSVGVYQNLSPRLGSMSGRIAVLVAAAALAVGCSEPVYLPDRSDPAVQAQEARIVTVLESASDIWVPGPCTVRLLRQEGATSYAWAVCEGYETPEAPEKSAWSGPVRVDGDQVSQPRDGDLYGSDVRKMFPADLVTVIFDQRPDVMP